MSLSALNSPNPVKRWTFQIALGAALFMMSLFLGALLYFQWISSDASSFALLRGFTVMRATNAVFYEVEPHRYLIRGGFRSSEFEAYRGQWGWKFHDQMGADLFYVRGEEQLSGSFFGCGPGHCLVVLYDDPVTALPLNQKRPWNAFR